MLQNAYFLAKIGADTAENEQHSAEILPTDALGLRPDPGLRHFEVRRGAVEAVPKQRAAYSEIQIRTTRMSRQKLVSDFDDQCGIGECGELRYWHHIGV